MAADFKICPSCGTRAKVKWEFCVRCGESILDVAPGESGASASKVPVSADEGPGVPWRGVIGMLALLVCAVAAYSFIRSAQKSPPVNPAIFAWPPVTMTPQPAAAQVRAPGIDDFLKGRELLSQGKAAEAVPYLRRAVADQSDRADFHHTLALALWQILSFDEAVTCFANAVRLAPDTTVYRVNYAMALSNRSRDNEAIREYETIARQQPANIETLKRLAYLYNKTGVNDKALATMRKVVDMNPTDLPLSQYLGYALEREGRLAEAEDMYRQVIGVARDAHVTRGLLAEVLMKQGKHEDAIETLKGGLQHYPNLPVLHRNLASIYERAGRVEEAVKEYREYARLAPNAPDAQAITERADSLAGTAPSNPS